MITIAGCLPAPPRNPQRRRASRMWWTPRLRPRRRTGTGDATAPSRMATRIAAASFLAVSVLVAWLTITQPFAARLLQVLIVISIAYVGWLALRGARVIRLALAQPDEPTGSADGLPFVSVVLPAS